MEIPNNPDNLPNEDDLLRQCLDGKITHDEYFQKRDLLDEYRKKRARLQEQENHALMIEKEIERCRGVKTNREFGQIPNPWKAGQVNLTNQMRLIHEGDRSVIEFLAMDAGVVLPDYSSIDRAQAEAKQRSIDEYKRRTEEIRKTNQALASRFGPNSGGLNY